MKSQPVFQTANAKTSKGEALGYLTLIRYLAPADESGTNVCPNAGACREVCLYTAGRGAFKQVKEARIRKTRERLESRTSHMYKAAQEIEAGLKRATKLGMKLAVRMNGTSDLVADAREMAWAFPKVQFYDYTKLVKVLDNLYTPPNLHYTLSFDPKTVGVDLCRAALSSGVNVAVVFTEAPPATLWDAPVIDGDEHDLRFLDPKGADGKGVVVALKAKGQAKGSSFCYDPARDI